MTLSMGNMLKMQQYLVLIKDRTKAGFTLLLQRVIETLLEVQPPQASLNIDFGKYFILFNPQSEHNSPK